MVSQQTFQHKLADLRSCLPLPEGSIPESQYRVRAYDRLLRDLDEADFVEACDRIIVSDEWFPTVARIVAVADECARDRRRRAVQVASRRPVSRLVCPYCHG